MKAEFSYTGKSYAVAVASACLSMFLLVFGLAFPIGRDVGIILGLVIVLLMINSFFFMLMKGEISVEDKEFKVTQTIFGKTFYYYTISLGKIRDASYEVIPTEMKMTDYVLYSQKLTVRLHNGVVRTFMIFFMKDDGKAFDKTSNEYKNYVADLPLTQLCEYINEIKSRK